MIGLRELGEVIGRGDQNRRFRFCSRGIEFFCYMHEMQWFLCVYQCGEGSHSPRSYLNNSSGKNYNFLQSQLIHEQLFPTIFLRCWIIVHPFPNEGFLVAPPANVIHYHNSKTNNEKEKKIIVAAKKKKKLWIPGRGDYPPSWPP